MTLSELQKKVKVRVLGYGRYSVDIVYRGKKYHCISNNMNAYVAAREKAKPNSVESRVARYSEKTALEAFYSECKRKNKL